MPLLFRRKRGRRPTQPPVSAPTPPPGPVPPDLEPPVRPAAAPVAREACLSVGDGQGVGLLAVWDLPQLAEHGVDGDDFDGQPPIKVKIQEVSATTDNAPSDQQAQQTEQTLQTLQTLQTATETDQPAVSVNPPDDNATATECACEWARARMAELHVELQVLRESERAAQEAVLGLRREIIRHEADNGRMHAALCEMQAALDSFRAEEQQIQETMASLRAESLRVQELEQTALRVQQLEQVDAENKELIATLQDKLGQLEAQLDAQHGHHYHQQQQQQQQQEQHYHDQLQLEKHHHEMHHGYAMEEVMGYGQFPIAYGPIGAAGPGPAEFGYAMHPGHPGHPGHHVHPGHPPSLLDQQCAHQHQHQEAPQPPQPAPPPHPHPQPVRRDANQRHHLPAVHQPAPLPLPETLPLPPVPQPQQLRAKKRVRQCFNCQKFNHDAKHCNGETTCLVCGSVGHTHKECDSSETRCANCLGPHRASFRECPVRVRLGWSPTGPTPSSPSMTQPQPQPVA